MRVRELGACRSARGTTVESVRVGPTTPASSSQRECPRRIRHGRPRPSCSLRRYKADIWRRSVDIRGVPPGNARAEAGSIAKRGAPASLCGPPRLAIRIRHTPNARDASTRAKQIQWVAAEAAAPILHRRNLRVTGRSTSGRRKEPRRLLISSDPQYAHGAAGLRGESLLTATQAYTAPR